MEVESGYQLDLLPLMVQTIMLIQHYQESRSTLARFFVSDSRIGAVESSHNCELHRSKNMLAGVMTCACTLTSFSNRAQCAPSIECDLL